MKKRCAWAGDDSLYIAYHDDEWGVPSFVQVTITNQQLQVWGDRTNDSRALLKPGSSNRIAAAWTTTSTG